MEKSYLLGSYYQGKPNQKVDALTNKDLRVFLVDDNKAYLEMLKNEIQENDDCDVFTFTESESCLNALHLKPDLVIVDYYLDPHDSCKNGEVLLQKIKEFNPNIQVVVISGDEKLTLTKDFRKLGAAQFLIKASNQEVKGIKGHMKLIFSKKAELYSTNFLIGLFITLIIAFLAILLINL